MIAAMGTVGLLSAALITFTYQTTLPRIKENKARYLEKSIFEVLPGATQKKIFRFVGDDGLEPLTEGDERSRRVYAGYKDDGTPAGIAIEAQGQGFVDVIGIIYGYDPDCQCVVGMKVLDSRETPGLGDKIEKDPKFRANFEALDVKVDESGQAINPLKLVKSGKKSNPWEVDNITGATISSRAITKILRTSTGEVVARLRKNRNVMFEEQK